MRLSQIESYVSSAADAIITTAAREILAKRVLKYFMSAETDVEKTGGCCKCGGRKVGKVALVYPNCEPQGEWRVYIDENCPNYS